MIKERQDPRSVQHSHSTGFYFLLFLPARGTTSERSASRVVYLCSSRVHALSVAACSQAKFAALEDGSPPVPLVTRFCRSLKTLIPCDSLSVAIAHNAIVWSHPCGVASPLTVQKSLLHKRRTLLSQASRLYDLGLNRGKE